MTTDKINLTRLIGAGNTVSFMYYRAETFYYKVGYHYDVSLVTGLPLKDYTEEEIAGGFKSQTTHYMFPVSLEEAKGAEMKNIDRAITYMRWIRKAIAEGTFVLLSQETHDIS